MRRSPTKEGNQRKCQRWRVAQMFEGIDFLIIRCGGQTIERQILKLTPVRLQIIRLFSPTVQNCYLDGF